MSRASILAALALAAITAIPAAFAGEEPQDIKWTAIPNSPMKIAILSGNPDEPGPFVVRYWMPSGKRFVPHRYADQREVTVLKGIFWVAEGESYNWRDMNEYKQGAVIVREAGKPYYAWARTEVMLEERGTGPTVIEYVNPEDDPRNKRKRRSSASE